METLIKRLAGLVTVKSIVTLLMSAGFTVLSFRGVISGQEFLTVFSVVIAFYFGTQSQRVADAIDRAEEEAR